MALDCNITGTQMFSFSTVMGHKTTQFSHDLSLFKLLQKSCTMYGNIICPWVAVYLIVNTNIEEPFGTSYSSR